MAGLAIGADFTPDPPPIGSDFVPDAPAQALQGSPEGSTAQIVNDILARRAANPPSQVPTYADQATDWLQHAEEAKQQYVDDAVRSGLRGISSIGATEPEDLQPSPAEDFLANNISGLTSSESLAAFPLFGMGAAPRLAMGMGALGSVPENIGEGEYPQAALNAIMGAAMMHGGPEAQAAPNVDAAVRESMAQAETAPSDQALTGFRGEPKGPSPAGQAHGVGTYYGLTPEVANRFSKQGTVEQQPVNLENPLVINSDSELRQARESAGVNPDPRMLLSKQEAQTFTNQLQGQGFDGVILNYDEAPGGKQVVVFPNLQPEQPAATIPNWAREEMSRRGLSPSRTFNDVDLQNTSIREAISKDPTLTEEQKAQVLKTGSLNEPAARPNPERLQASQAEAGQHESAPAEPAAMGRGSGAGESAQAGQAAVIPPEDARYAGLPEQPQGVGVAERYANEELGAGSVIPGTVHDAGYWRDKGTAYINAGGDPRLPIRAAVAGRVGPRDVGIVSAEYQRLVQNRRLAASALEQRPNDPALQQGFQQASDAAVKWRQEMQPVMTRWAEAGHVMQGEAPVDLTTFDGLHAEAQKLNGGRELTAAQKAALISRGKTGQALRDAEAKALAKRDGVIDRTLPKVNTPTPEGMQAMVDDMVKRMTPCR